MTASGGAGRTGSILAVGAVIRSVEGSGPLRFLLVLRRNEPHARHWALPGGKVEPGETLSEAVVREVWEETGLHVAPVAELWTSRVPTGALATLPSDAELPAGSERQFEVHTFAVTVESGSVIAGDDAADARWFTLQEMDAVPTTPGLATRLSGMIGDC